MILIKEIAQQAFNQSNLSQLTRKQAYPNLTTQISQENIDCYYCLSRASQINQSKAKIIIC